MIIPLITKNMMLNSLIIPHKIIIMPHNIRFMLLNIMIIPLKIILVLLNNIIMLHTLKRNDRNVKRKAYSDKQNDYNA
jgi:hypothetical protein